MPDVAELARSVFGFDLRPAQRRAAETVAAGRDTLAVLPTGSGKSAIYQVAGLARTGVTVVVSPLIALQRDQVRSLTALGLRAALLNSSLHSGQRADVLTALRAGETDFVMLGPEQLANDETLRELTAGPRPIT